MGRHRGLISGLLDPPTDQLSDRAQDVWEPLLAIADLAAGDWPVARDGLPSRSWGLWRTLTRRLNYYEYADILVKTKAAIIPAEGQ